MNLLLLEDSQMRGTKLAVAKPQQAKHIRTVLKLKDGANIKLGRLNGPIGMGVVRYDGESVLFEDLVFTSVPPPQLPVTLVLGMPRPQMLKRILQTISTMGVSRVCFLQTSRVEKSFWQSPSATQEAIRSHLLLGLEQGMATQLPVVEKFERFRPFVEDKLDQIAQGSLKFIGHPDAALAPQEYSPSTNITLAIGPEGGFIDKEVQAFEDRGFQPVHLGQRILKVETAVPVLLAKLFKFEK